MHRNVLVLVLVLVFVASLTNVACDSVDRRPHDGFTMTTWSTHDRFPIDGDAVHARADCNHCHGGLESFTQFTCISCHEHGESPMTARHAGVEHFVYASDGCYACHPDGMAMSGAAGDHRAFPIEPGAVHATTACATCHTNPTDRADVACAACHSRETPQLVTRHATVPDFDAADSATCLACHADGVVPIALATHDTAHFPLRGGHLACLSCHPDRRADKPFEAASWATVGCADACHEHERPTTDGVHQGIGDYDFATSACLSCHPQGEANGASRDDHIAFPVASGTLHGGVSCDSCHSSATDRRQTACAACHQIETPNLAAAHTAVKGYVAGDNALCKKCHADADVPITVAGHTTSAFRISNSRHNKSCFACHLGVRADKPFPAAEWSGFSCDGTCHEHTKSEMDSEHWGRSGYSYSFTRCLDCHPDG